MKVYLIFGCLFFSWCSILAQTKVIELTGNKELLPVNVNIAEVDYEKKKSVKVTAIKGNETALVKINDVDFTNGIIELDLAGKRQEDSHPMNRGFVGVAFRITDDNVKFEQFYLRAANGRADDQVQRNHTAQYSSYPDYHFDVLRKESPEKYEAYVDMVPGEWTHVKIEVEGGKAKLYVHGNSQPTLIVNDLKLGANARGAIGLWVGGGTDAHFANLKVTQRE